MIKNIAIIAHVDHGKTSLIDSMLSQSGVLEASQQNERVMDSNDIEKERGITILAKCTAVHWNDQKFNIIDTPGHSDFGGEVERILCMADSALILVDAAEGPMPQTKFVLSKALKLGLKPIVVINKIDRKDAEPERVLNEIFDLFVSLDANDEQLDFQVLYAVGRDGWCTDDYTKKTDNLSILFEYIDKYTPNHNLDKNKPFSMLVTMLDSDNFIGKLLIGRVMSGVAKINAPIKGIDLDGKIVNTGKLTKLQTFLGTKRIQTEEVEAGDIVCIAGIDIVTVSDTVASIEVTEPIQSTPIDPPTMSINISQNTSPLAGKEGSKVTSRNIHDYLMAENETNVAITVKESENKDYYELSGRGELQLGIIIENMRRQGFELSISGPKVIFRTNENGQKEEPIEEVLVDVDEQYSGTVIEKMSHRKAEMVNMVNSKDGKTRITFHAPSRGLLGYQSEFLSDTKGTGIMNRLFHSYGKYKGEIKNLRNGALISMVDGEAVAYAIFNLQDRGIMFVEPQDVVYKGMIVGEHSRVNDLDINIVKGKQLTNVRASGTDKAVILNTPRKMTLEEMITYIREDELVEVTPTSLRLRKKYLDINDRKKYGKK